MRAFQILAIVVVSAAIAGYAGYALGVKRTEYRYSRYQISNFLWANAMVESGDTKRIKEGSDVFFRGAYAYIKRQPSWISWFSPDRKRDPDLRIKQVAVELKESLDGSSSTPSSEKEVELFVRTYMGTHSTLRGGQALGVSSISK
jgi:hypothetical protein